MLVVVLQRAAKLGNASTRSSDTRVPCTLPRATVIGFFEVGALVKSTPMMWREVKAAACDDMHGLCWAALGTIAA